MGIDSLQKRVEMITDSLGRFRYEWLGFDKFCMPQPGPTVYDYPSYEDRLIHALESAGVDHLLAAPVLPFLERSIQSSRRFYELTSTTKDIRQVALELSGEASLLIPLTSNDLAVYFGDEHMVVAGSREFLADYFDDLQAARMKFLDYDDWAWPTIVPFMRTLEPYLEWVKRGR